MNRGKGNTVGVNAFRLESARFLAIRREVAARTVKKAMQRIRETLGNNGVGSEERTVLDSIFGWMQNGAFNRTMALLVFECRTEPVCCSTAWLLGNQVVLSGHTWAFTRGRGLGLAAFQSKMLLVDLLPDHRCDESLRRWSLRSCRAHDESGVFVAVPATRMGERLCKLSGMSLATDMSSPVPWGDKVYAIGSDQIANRARCILDRLVSLSMDYDLTMVLPPIQLSPVGNRKWAPNSEVNAQTRRAPESAEGSDWEVRPLWQPPAT